MQALDLPLAQPNIHQPLLYPVAIVASEITAAGDPSQHRVLVQWAGLPPEDSTWEVLSELLQDYPDLHLEDKVFLKGRANDGLTGRSGVSPIGGEEDETEVALDSRPKRNTKRPSNWSDYEHVF